MLSGEPTTGVCRLLLTPVAIQTQHATIKRSLRPPPTLYCLPPSSHYIFVVPATNQLPAPKGDWQSACAQLQWRAAICPRFHISRIDQVRRACRQAPTSSTGFTYNEVSNEKIQRHAHAPGVPSCPLRLWHWGLLRTRAPSALPSWCSLCLLRATGTCLRPRECA